MPLFDIRPLRQQGAFGIAFSLFDSNRRCRDDEATSTAEQQRQQQQQQQDDESQQHLQDLSKLIPEALELSIKLNGGDPAHLVLRFRFDNILNDNYKEKVFEVLKIAFARSAAADTNINNNNNDNNNNDKKQSLETFTLDLERCGVTDAVLSEIFDYFENVQRNTLTHLFLAGNLITAKGLQRLLHVPNKNPPMTTETGKHLQHLGVTANPLGGHGLDVLSEYLEINPITNKLKILHATRIAWASQSSLALRLATSQSDGSTTTNSSSDSNDGNMNGNSQAVTARAHLVRPPPAARPPGMITIYEAERFANAVKNAVELATVYFKQNAIQKSVDDEVPWPSKKVIF